MAGLFSSIGNFLFGSPGKQKNVSTLRPEQEGLYQQLIEATKNRGAGGAFGSASDYYRGLLDDSGQDYQAFAAPIMRQYQEDILPSISEQFAGMGSGALSSSGFRNAQVQGATDLSERLASLRASLRQSGAQGLSNIGQLGLSPYSQSMMTTQPTKGFLGSISSGFGNAFGQALGNWFNPGSSGMKVGQKISPYGASGPIASPSGGR